MNELIEIKCREYSAVINLSNGANCIKLKDNINNCDILRQPNFSKELDNPYVYGMPILFPVNRIEKGTFDFEGRNYSFPINENKTNCHLHGKLHKMPFSVEKRGENYVVCSFFEFARTGFPHSYKVVITYKVDFNGLTQTTEIFNMSDTNMPVFLGYHTTFNVCFAENSKKENICVKADVKDEIERNMENYLPTGRILSKDSVTKALNDGNFKPFKNKISRHYRTLDKGIIELIDEKNRLKVVYKNDKLFKFRLFFNVDTDEFICLEPMTCMANCQNAPLDKEESGFDFISPKLSKKYTSNIRVEVIK